MRTHRICAHCGSKIKVSGPDGKMNWLRHLETAKHRKAHDQYLRQGNMIHADSE